MIPHYKAIAIEESSIKGGTSKPCLLSVADEHNIPQGVYVVKLFKQNYIQQDFPTFKELLCNQLAIEFELQVPEAALIEISPQILRRLVAKDKRNVDDYVPGIYFGTKYINNPINYSKALLPTTFKDWQIENIFAFDVLIRNTDRRIGKPNLFLKNDDVFLIDHEHTFGVQQNFTECLAHWQQIWHYILTQDEKRQYVFIQHIRQWHKKNPFTFDEFEENLRTLSLRLLDICAELLEEAGHEPIDYFSIKAYLQEIKDDFSSFRKLLLDLING